MKTLCSNLFGHFRELGLEAVRRGGCKFTFEPMMYIELSRKGFTVRDELEAFCWLSGSIFAPNAEAMMTCDVKVPDYVFWEYWLDRLSGTIGDMGRY